jgi:lysine 6-dehydrogenase
MKSLCVLGAGMQGVAAAYDATLYGEFDRIQLVDKDIARAIDGAERVNSLLAADCCEPIRADASSRDSLRALLKEGGLAISALPYNMHALAEDIALEMGCNIVDMGRDDARAIHARDAEARSRTCTVVTDCGLAPGLVNILATDLVRTHPDATTARVYCGGLPERPVPPLGYVLRFSMDSVVAEYSDPVLSLRNGVVEHFAPLDLVEEVDFDGLGRLEGFTTSGGSGTAPYSLQSRISNFEYKTLRYAGHLAAMKLFRNCGFWSTEHSLAEGLSPRQAFCAVMERELSRPEVNDIVAVRVEVDTPDATHRLEMLERHNSLTGFTAMEQLTGFSTSIVALEIALGSIGPGCFGCETAIDPMRFRAELARRGFEIQSTVHQHRAAVCIGS